MKIRVIWLLVLSAASAAAQVRASFATTPAVPSAAISLDEAIALARANEPLFAAAAAEKRALALDSTNAKAALLPTVTYHNQAIYTQPNGVASSRIGQVTGDESPIFIANNSVREYASQGLIDEKIGLGQVAEIRVANANALRAEAEVEVARRGLVTTVTSLYFGSQSAMQRASIAAQALTEANHFLEITQERETAREVAHADVLKAQLEQQQRERELANAKVEAVKASLELGVLLYPDPSTSYTLDSSALPTALADRTTIDVLAKQNNPEVHSALAGLQAARAKTFSSRAALAPDLALNYTYGIDATNFGARGPDGIHNLGYSMSATLDIPLWDWLSTERKIKVSRLRENAAKVAFSATQRRLVADLEEFYNEASLASQQLASLDQSVVIARESLRLINLRYVDGESTALEVVDAQNGVITAENAQVDGQLQYQLSRAHLQILTGRLP